MIAVKVVFEAFKASLRMTSVACLSDLTTIPVKWHKQEKVAPELYARRHQVRLHLSFTSVSVETRGYEFKKNVIPACRLLQNR